MRPDARLNRPEFWAAHFYQLLDSPDRPARSLLEPVFGVGYEAMHSFIEDELERAEDAEDLVELEVSEHAAVAVSYVDCGDSGSEQRFYVTLGDWDEWELAGYDSPHFALPAFRWEELVALDRVHPAVMLLLLPAASIPDTGVDLEPLREAWKRHPLIRAADPMDLTEHVAHKLRQRRVQWWKDDELGWINDGRYSLRNPGTRMSGFSKGRFERMSAFFEVATPELSGS
jgi:hypothetical protein